ncbi:PAS/PAC sensor signal transduction histidine kinase [Halogeometricum pallidum JCM 14848]|uniref:histidine kinase n=1 Tax=Halogeometricum pallidum JCM 14848 TaxID=1227487 RepID=M0CZ49_HALPD|nr:PAS domain-containing sensor histidine kinase [Halogeometricum pallidum]ELZ27169.1 PAS/PAC sensor signal transduction histidine kinase [Halogeometricum pallidum JCM 14848]
MNREILEGDEEFLRSLLESTTEGILVIDTESRIRFANPAIEPILGYRPEELVGREKMIIIPERLRSTHEDGLAQYLDTGEQHIDWTGVDLPALHKDGHEVPVSVSIEEFTYRDERLFCGVFTDVTDRKRRERRLRKQANELEEFAGVLSHDLRNPLSVAQGYLQLARDDDSEVLRKITESLDRMEQMIDDTLAHARDAQAADETEVTSLRELVQAAWQSVVTDEATLVLPSERWRIRAHEGRVRQLVENLVRNAVEHGSTGSETESHDAVEHGTGDGESDGTRVTVRVGVLDGEDGFYVEDDGPGLPDHVKAQLEASAESTSDHTGGYGLNIVQTVAAEHGWEMRVADAESGGARFEFRGMSFVH